jgi:hypothetical protein
VNLSKSRWITSILKKTIFYNFNRIAVPPSLISASIKHSNIYSKVYLCQITMTHRNSTKFRWFKHARIHLDVTPPKKSTNKTERVISEVRESKSTVLKSDYTIYIKILHPINERTLLYNSIDKVSPFSYPPYVLWFSKILCYFSQNSKHDTDPIIN